MLVEDDDPESSQEERVFKMWMNSLNADECYIQNFFEDLKDGINLCKIEDKLFPGSVTWKKVTKPAKSRIIKI
jgi:plastin-1